MAHGKAAARDLQWGRQGGGWQESTAGEALDAVDKARSSSGSWPTLADDRDLFRPADDAGWAGRARMAHARRAAGVALTPLDREALDLFPSDLGLAEAARITEELACA